MDTTLNNENKTKKNNENALLGKISAASAGVGAVVGGVVGAAIAGHEAQAAEAEVLAEVQPQVEEEHTTEHEHHHEAEEHNTHNEHHETHTDHVTNHHDDVDVNPDDVAQGIVAGEEIDPNDTNYDAAFEVEDVVIVYGADGEEYDGAIITDVDGNEIVMVDVTGDGEFNQLLDSDGNVIGGAEDGVGITMSDVELQMNTELEYMEADNVAMDNTPDSIMDDIILT